MPYVALAPAAREARLAAAAARWDAILAVRPDLQPAVALQQELLDLVSGVAETIGDGRLPKLSLPPRYLVAKLDRGVPALAGEPIPVPVPLLKPTLLALCDSLARGGAGDAAANIRTQISETRMDAGSLLAASLKRDQHAIRIGAQHRSLAPDLLWLVAELAVSPFAYALHRALFASALPDTPLAAALDRWNRGFCPLCGSWPALAEVASTHRVLRCSFCALAWELNSYACVYCEEDGELFVTAAPDLERTDRRIEVCKKCGAYLKTVDVPELSPFPLLAITDLETMDLDMAAMEHGYMRPPLRDFTPVLGNFRS
jgi:FdhE protein